MILKKLNLANKILLEIIKITNEDIENIKKANHNFVLEHAQKKTDLLKEFSKTKAELEEALVELCSKYPDRDMQVLLGESEQDGLKALRINLKTLKAKNKEYAKYALVVKDFFNQMLKTIMKEKGTDFAYGESSQMILKVNA